MSAPDDEVQALTEGTVADIVDMIPSLTEDDLESLAVYEQHGKARKGVLSAIEDELAQRNPVPEAAPEPVAKHAQGIPERFGRPILTEAGWVVPEPHQLPEA